MTNRRLTKVGVLIAVGALCGGSCGRPSVVTVRDGDIVFQTSRSAQSQAVRLATHSPYSHKGLVLYRNAKPLVFEAVARVRFTPFEEWVRRGEGGRFVVKRLRDRELLGDHGRLAALRDAALAFEGRPYDPYFEWSDDRIYCSELVWKAYDRGIGVQLGLPCAPVDLRFVQSVGEVDAGGALRGHGALGRARNFSGRHLRLSFASGGAVKRPWGERAG